MQQGYIKLYRKLLDNPVACRDADHFAVWCYLLLCAAHADVPAIFGEKPITLRPGQLITGRRSIAGRFQIPDWKVQRILKCFEIEKLIVQVFGGWNRLITVVNWAQYQYTASIGVEVLHTNKKEKKCPVSRQTRKPDDTGRRKTVYPHDTDEYRLALGLAGMLRENRAYALRGNQAYALRENQAYALRGNIDASEPDKDCAGKTGARNPDGPDAPSMSEHRLQVWATTFGRMIRLDGRSPHLIYDVMYWSQNNRFWRANILSAEGLLRQFDRLWLEMEERGSPKGKPDFAESETL